MAEKKLETHEKHRKTIEALLKDPNDCPFLRALVPWSFRTHPWPRAVLLWLLHHLTKFISRATQVAPHNIGALAR